MCPAKKSQVFFVSATSSLRKRPDVVDLKMRCLVALDARCTGEAALLVTLFFDLSLGFSLDVARMLLYF